MANKRVMVVDDEPRICQFLNIKLGISGYDVVTTSDGSDAIELARTRNPDIILLDIVMPGVSGMEVLEQVRSFSPHVPVIVFTGRPEVARIAMQFGADDYIAKPFDPDLLVKKIKRALGARQGTTKK